MSLSLGLGRAGSRCFAELPQAETGLTRCHFRRAIMIFSEGRNVANTAKTEFTDHRHQAEAVDVIDLGAQFHILSGKDRLLPKNLDTTSSLGRE